MIKKLNLIRDIHSNNQINPTTISKFTTQRNSFKNAYDNTKQPMDNMRMSRFAQLEESPFKEISEQKEENRKNFHSTQGKFFTKNKDEKMNMYFNPKKEKGDNAVSLHSTVDLFENLNNKLENNKNKIKIENGENNKFYRTENTLKKNLSPKKHFFQSQEMTKNNLDKFLFDTKKKMNTIEEKVKQYERNKKMMSNKNIGTTTKTLVNIDNLKFPYQNNLDKYAEQKDGTATSPLKRGDNKNINININNKITNIYEIKGGYIDGNEKPKSKTNLSEEEIAQRLNLYKSKLNSEFIKVINDEKNKEKERMSQYENPENEDEKRDIEKEISSERALSSDRIHKINLIWLEVWSI